MPQLSAVELDEYARSYYLSGQVDDLDIEERAQRHSIPLILRAVRGATSVLEMGYGTGLITGELRRAGVPVEVVEGSPLLAAQARRDHPGLVVHEAMFEAFRPSEPAGAVLALHVLEHVDEPRELVSHLRSWLAPDGRFVAVTPNARSLHRRVAVAMGLQDRYDTLSGRDHLVGHRRVYDLRGLRADLVAGGLETIDEFGYFVKPLANAQMADWSEALLEGFNDVAGDVPADLCANIGLVATQPVATQPVGPAGRRREARA